MRILKIEIDESSLQIETVEFEGDMFTFALKDGRRLTAPLWWYPRLQSATPEQREAWEILPFGDGVEWEQIDEHISAKGLVIGGPCKGAIEPMQAAG